ncbi:MAG: MFS transporter [Deltaproteobacteria bacterium]|nr:MFS transporter [Deltaproteobacteria bacterium]
METESSGKALLNEGLAASRASSPVANPIQQVLSVLGAAIGLAVGFAPVYFGTLSVFLKPIASEFAWGRAETSLAGVLSMLGGSFGAVLLGRLIDRFGPARIIPPSVLLTSVMIGLLSGMWNNAWLFTALSFIIGFFGVGTTPPGYMSVLAQRFDRRLGLSFGLAGLGMGVGTVVMPMIAQWLIGSFGWRAAYTYMAIGAAVLGGLACAILFLTRRKDSGKAKAVTHPQGDASEQVAGATIKEALRDMRFWLVSAVIFVVAVATLGMAIHLVAFITDKGITAAAAAKAAAIAGVGVVLGRVISGFLLDIYHAPRIAFIVYLLAALGVALLATSAATGIAGLAFCVLLLGFAIGSEADLMPYFVRRYFGLKSFGLIYGSVFFLFGVGGVVGPVVFGMCYDRLGSYSTAMWGASLVLICSALAILLMGPYRYGPEVTKK